MAPAARAHAHPAVAALAGLLAGAAALTLLEVLGRLVPGAAPPVVAVGDRVVALAPPALRDAAIAAFGTGDKPVLLASVLAGVLALAAVGGVLAAGAPRRGDVAVAALAVVAVLVQAGRPGTSLVGAVVAAAGAGLVGGLLLRGLLRSATRPPPAGRRAFLAQAAAAAGVVVLGGAGTLALEARTRVEDLRAKVRLPQPARRASGSLPAASLDVPGLSPVLTPNADFYRIDTALRVPQVDVRGWTLTVDGLVDRRLVLRYDDLLARRLVEADITLQCVSNEVGGDLVGTARWQGVLLAELLDEAGVRPGADQVMGWSVDGFTAGFPTAVARDGRQAMVAVAMNGEPLPVRHGFPARLVVPGLYGYVSATKWLRRVELTTFAAAEGFWVPRGWSRLGPIKTASRIDVPRGGAQVAAGEVVVAGVAWAPRRGISAVQVQVDGGPWQPAELAAALSDDTWRQWRLRWTASPGEHVLRVRAVDGAGRPQDEQARPPRPDGATGLHTARVRVR